MHVLYVGHHGHVGLSAQPCRRLCLIGLHVTSYFVLPADDTPPPPSPGEPLPWALASAARGERIVLVVEELATGTVVGTVVFYKQLGGG